MVKSSSQTISWNPADYAANSAAQQSWARELIARLKLRGDEHLLDVGCGDGKVTAELAAAVPEGAVTGIDASAEMVEFARKAFPAAKFPNLKFVVADAQHFAGVFFSAPSPPPKEERAGVRRHVISGSTPLTPTLSPLGRGEGEDARKFDLIFSNAALHWVDDHEAFLRGASVCLRPGGRLIVSCGGKGNAHEVFLALRPEMRTARWRGFFRKMPKPYFFYAPEDYEKWLPRFGFKTRRVKLAPKDATYPGREGFAAWLRTTWLPYTQRVPAPMREDFIAAVADRYVARHPVDASGRVRVRMVRLEIDAIKV